MPNILLLSDTHAFLDPLVSKYAKTCDEIWHAGDIGALSVLDELSQIKPVKAVFGNIDDHLIRVSCPENQIFECGGMKIYMTHIGGSPGKYPSEIKY